MVLQLVDALGELIDADDEAGDGEEEPVEDEGGGDEEGVALALHDGLLVAEVVGRGAGGGFAGGAGLVLPVDVHEEEDAEGDDGEEGLEGRAGDGDEALAQAVEAGQGQEEEHDRLRAGGVAQHHPLQRHRPPKP